MAISMTPSHSFRHPERPATADRGALFAAHKWHERAAAPMPARDRATASGLRNAHQTMRHAASRFLRMASAATGEDRLS